MSIRHIISPATPRFTRRVLALAATLITALSIFGTTAGIATAASSQAHSSTVQAMRGWCGVGSLPPCTSSAIQG
jgi:hypothetical protein